MVPLALILIIPLAITLAVPVRYFGFYVACMAMLAITFVLLPSGPDHSSPFSGIDQPLNIIIGIALTATIGVRAVLIELRRPASPSPPQPNHALWTLTGLLAGFCGVVTVSLALS